MAKIVSAFTTSKDFKSLIIFDMPSLGKMDMLWFGLAIPDDREKAM
jgi:hypothetical protein